MARRLSAVFFVVAVVCFLLGGYFWYQSTQKISIEQTEVRLLGKPGEKIPIEIVIKNRGLTASEVYGLSGC